MWEGRTQISAGTGPEKLSSVHCRANLNRDVAGNMKTEKKKRVPNYKERASSYHKHLN